MSDKELLLARFFQLRDRHRPPDYWGTLQGFSVDPSFFFTMESI
jgi:hypothetical protein